MPQIINTLAINDVLPGMCLASDLHHPSGNLLLPRHTELNSQLLNNLRKQGIVTLQISCKLPEPILHAVASTPQSTPDTDAVRDYQQKYDLIMSEVRQMFRGNNLDSVNHALQQAILEHRLAQLPPRPQDKTEGHAEVDISHTAAPQSLANSTATH